MKIGNKYRNKETGEVKELIRVEFCFVCRVYVWTDETWEYGFKVRQEWDKI